MKHIVTKCYYMTLRVMITENGENDRQHSSPHGVFSWMVRVTKYKPIKKTFTKLENSAKLEIL